MQRLTQVNPAGRFDVLLYRLIEAAAEKVCKPEEWKIFEPLVERFIAGQFGGRA